MVLERHDTLQHQDEDVRFHTPVRHGVTVYPSQQQFVFTTRCDIECELNYKCHVVNKTFSSQFTSDCHIYYRHNTLSHLPAQRGPDLRSRSVLIAACLLVSSHPLLLSVNHCPNLYLSISLVVMIHLLFGRTS